MTQRNRGFTLIEVLVASALTALIGVIAYGFLSTALNAQASQRTQADRLNEINLFFAALARDVRQAVNRPIRDELGETQAAVLGGPGTQYLLSLTRGGWYNPRAVTRSSLQRVAYGLNSEQQIERVAWQVLDRVSEDNSYKAVVLSAVDEVYFRFLDATEIRVDADDVGKDWSESWPEDPQLGGNVQEQLLPAAIEITLTLQDLGEVRRLFALPVEREAQPL